MAFCSPLLAPRRHGEERKRRGHLTNKPLRLLRFTRNDSHWIRQPDINHRFGTIIAILMLLKGICS